MSKLSSTRTRPIRVLIIDDSMVVRRTLSQALASCPDIEVVGLARDAYDGRDQIVALAPDVITLDLEMPRMDGLTFLEKLMRAHPMPVVVYSSISGEESQAALRALELGAVEVQGKPDSAAGVKRSYQAVAQSIRTAARARLVCGSSPAATRGTGQALSKAEFSSNIIAIGASTGGTVAIREVLDQLPALVPPILIVQHMPAGFTAPFAARLDSLCPMDVKEAAEGDQLRPGLALIAPGGLHMVLEQGRSGHHKVSLRDGDKVHHQKPAVDVLFDSIAALAGPRTVATVLTGMGADGAAGLLALRKAGARTLAQDEESCVVYGMPREAASLGGAAKIVPLDSMGAALLQAIRKP